MLASYHDHGNAAFLAISWGSGQDVAGLPPAGPGPASPG
jgi:hypothetical protein